MVNIGNESLFKGKKEEKRNKCKYELEMAKKYDFVTVADWYQVAKENISIWNGTDGVHFGSDSDSINRGAKLYTKTIKEAIEKADKAPVKGGKK